jgi:hypothetical protein
MEIDAFFLADHVAIPGGDKFYVQGGGFTRCEVPGLPAAIPLGVLARVRIDDDEAKQEHQFKFALIGPTGMANVEPIEGTASVGETTPEPLEGEESFLQLGAIIPGVAVREGLYHVEFEIDHSLSRSIPLPVVVGPGSEAASD